MTDANSPLLQYAQYNLPRQRVELKSVWDDESAWITSGSTSERNTTATYYRAVPWLMRGIEMRANALASVPFQIVRGETPIDTSDEYKDALGILPDPYRMMWLLEAALCFGPAYLWREKNTRVTKALKYVAASTITPQIDPVLGLTGFSRQLSTGAPIKAKPEDVLYFWKPDPYVELGPPQVTPVGAALAASGVLFNLDAFTAAFWQRGAIRATLLTTDGASLPSARAELKAWWQKAVTGINNAFSANVINSGKVTPVVIGDGLDSLQNEGLTTKQREDISTALGIPFSVMNSTAAGGLGGGGVVSQDEKHFYDKTIRPECNYIAGELNRQLFAPMGLRFEFLLDGLDVFQEDEAQRAAAFKVYVDAGLPLEVSGLMLGLELPEGWTWERIANEKADRQAAIAEQMKPAVPPPAPGQPAQPQDAQQPEQPAQPNPFAAKATLDDLRKWRAKSKKRGSLADFESDTIPADVVDTIKSHGDNGWLEALDAAIAGTAPGADKDELTAFERVAFEYVKAADVFAQVLNGTQ
jgi:hypothetical protein